MDSKKIFDKFSGEAVFIKTAAKPPINAAQKAALNRRGNVLFNQGDIEGARRVFLTTGYSDGLVRIGDYYKSKGQCLDALRMYWIAPDKTKSEAIIVELSELIRSLISEGEKVKNEQ
ncbi:MAG: hypothetical protein LBL20_00550 [Treponema sp.]|jgi:hypothetical protein|nr:hypothetical protein [Treponema sp.]